MSECEDCAAWRETANDLRERLEEARAALAHYADRAAWTEVETTFTYAPYEWAFDWDGDLADKPWEIAEKALARLAPPEP
jgi:hypothetical protein